MPKNQTPAETAALWAARTGGAQEAYKRGVQRTDKDPMQEAIKAEGRLLANFTSSVTSGKWRTRTGAVNKGDWQRACTEKGAPALATAARLAQDKYARAEAKNKSIRDGIIAQLPPKGTVEENLERARLFGLKMHQESQRA